MSWIKLHRAIFDNEFFRPGKACETMAFIWLLKAASWKPGGRRVGEHYAKLERGELIASVRYLAKCWQWTPSAVARFLERCEHDGKIGTRTDTGITVITICNYELYQGEGDETDTADGTEAVQSRHSAGTEAVQSRHKVEEGKKERREEEEEGRGANRVAGDAPLLLDIPACKPSRKKPIAPMPANFELTGELRTYAERHGFTGEAANRLFQRFVNHHAAKGSRFSDWLAAWRNWVNREIDFDRERKAQIAKNDPYEDLYRGVQ